MQQKVVNNTGKVLLGATLGFTLFWITSHPKSKIKNRLPTKKYKKLVILPNLQYHHKDTIYHLHHWLLLSMCYLPLLRYKKMRQSKILHGLFLGSILQGLFYRDRFHIRYPKQILEEPDNTKLIIDTPLLVPEQE